MSTVHATSIDVVSVPPARPAYDPREHGASVANIVAVFARGTAEDYQRGQSWYSTAREIALGVGHGDGLTGAGILAALSPQLSWPVNVALAQRCSKARRFNAGHFRACLGKAKAIHRGQSPFEVLHGPKELAFACNIAHGVDCPHGAPCVTVDRHALSIAYGRIIGDQERSKLLGRVRTYDTVAQLYREAAALLHVAPSVLQAVTWIVWRKEKGIDD